MTYLRVIYRNENLCVILPPFPPCDLQGGNGGKMTRVTQFENQIICLAVCRRVCKHTSPCGYAPPLPLHIDNVPKLGGAVAEWVRASTCDRTVDGSSPTSVKKLFASELWQFRLPRFASVFRTIQ